ncbi:PRC-barrel domain-containing protein [Dictyobacter kobayashii]|uniref:PRC-barrel domain-containing protein n=1 Tax=Dictyobacter kobayashii TaxID=2014872 RepID=A0A402AMJ8_9CHLR|nr:PRC-barrel domain-containing protein [Dictyobacter kobayashii]GCE20254.1 hypothetical protein KDK_40540 [Dictyobacter kobayashii]
MENMPAAKKWSDIKGLTAVTMDLGKKMGVVDDFYFDPQSHSVLGFDIKTGLFGHRALLLQSIQGIGEDALTFTQEDALIKEQDNPALSAAFKGRDVLSYHVLSEGGTVVGNVGNALFHIELPQAITIAGYELAGGLRQMISRHYPAFTNQQIIRYGQDVLVIPDAVAVELMK